jgi:heme/copper-type cytochrome/quinol oxidase subunit 4
MVVSYDVNNQVFLFIVVTHGGVQRHFELNFFIHCRDTRRHPTTLK